MMINVKNLKYTYPGAEKEAVKGLTFEIEQGEIFGFLGPSGAGKSTTQKILIGLLTGYSGDVEVMGRSLSDWKSDYYQKVGVSFEAPNHYLKMTALENLNYFRALYDGPTVAPETLLKMVNLAEDGNQRVGGFSKGMKMRLNFARALIHQPSLIFLDEPTSGLDPVNAKLIKDIVLEQKAQGKTTFMTTHDMSVADRLCDRVAFIVDGEIQLIDSPNALKLAHGRREVAVEYGLNGQTQTEVFSLEKLRHNARFLDLLETTQVRTIHTQETTLEQIFIDVTGRSLK